ncbi:reverse transcriptase domain-containing protein [Tanacetum coccineum]
MPFGLRNAGATYQRLVDKIFHGQIGRNLEVYVDDLVIKSRTKDEETVNTKGIKICPDKVDAILSQQSPNALKELQKLNGKLAKSILLKGPSNSRFYRKRTRGRRVRDDSTKEEEPVLLATFEATNNEAEYEALIAGLRIAEKIGVQNLEVNVDSKLVANQLCTSQQAGVGGGIERKIREQKRGARRGRGRRGNPG